MKQRTVCSFCHNVLDPNALFCDICGTPHDIGHVYQIRSEMQHNVENLGVTLQSLETKRASLMREIQELENSLGTTKSTQLTELQSLENKRRALAEAIKSEEATIEVLHKERLELEHNAKPPVRKNSRANNSRQKKKPRGVKHETHSFIGKYEGKGDWNTELAKRIAQFNLTLDHTTYSISPEKVVFSVTGSRESIERLAAALNELEGFVNLRAKLAETKRNLRESMNARNVRQQQLDALNKAPWYKREKTPGLATQKDQLAQQLAQDDLRISALNESLKALENLVGGGTPPH
jgi:septal ring factor EnvC (AmiA/AmiB activator)